MISNVKNWVRTNITGTNGGRDYSQIESGYDQLQGQVDELNKPVEVSLQGSYADLTKRDKLLLGASAGAVVGGTLGMARGFLANAGDGMKLNIAWNTHDINTQKVEFDPIRRGISGTATMERSFKRRTLSAVCRCGSSRALWVMTGSFEATD